MARKLAPCGTNAAYQRHITYGEPVDDACREAHNNQAALYRGAGDNWRKRKAVNDEALRRLAARHRGELQQLRAAVLAEQADQARKDQRRRDERLFALLSGGQTT